MQRKYAFVLHCHVGNSYVTNVVCSHFWSEESCKHFLLDSVYKMSIDEKNGIFFFKCLSVAERTFLTIREHGVLSNVRRESACNFAQFDILSRRDGLSINTKRKWHTKTLNSSALAFLISQRFYNIKVYSNNQTRSNCSHVSRSLLSIVIDSLGVGCTFRFDRIRKVKRYPTMSRCEPIRPVCLSQDIVVYFISITHRFLRSTSWLMPEYTLPCA